MEAFLHDNPDAKLGFYTRGLADLGDKFWEDVLFVISW